MKLPYLIYILIGLLSAACSTTRRSSQAEGPPQGIDHEAVKQVITNNMNTFLSCYEKSLSLDQTLEGKIVLDWQIIAGGKVESPRVNDSKSEIIDPKMRACMIQKLSALNFPEPINTSNVAVSYPFIFKDSKQ